MTTLPRLLPAEQRLVDALERRGLTLADRITREIVAEVAQELGCAAPTVQTHVGVIRHHLREAGALPPRGPRVTPHSAGMTPGRPRKEAPPPYVQTGWLPEVPVLPLGCTDERVIARCQQGRRWR